MIAKKTLILLLILLFTVLPAAAAEVSLNRWAINIILDENGKVEEILQVDIGNGGSTPLDGFSFIIPASKVTMPNIASFSPNGQNVELKTVPGGTKIVVNFDKKLEPGKNWEGRIEFDAEDWAEKNNQDYSINVPVEAPMAITAGKEAVISAAAESEIRSQVFLPDSVNPTSIEPSIDPASGKPAYKKLLQYNQFARAHLIVLTWFQLNIGDVISIKASYSNDLHKIVQINGRLRNVSDLVEEAKKQGKDVSNAELHLSNARDYNNQAVDEFWEKKDPQASLDAANSEMELVESSLQAPARTEPKRTGGVQEDKNTPGFTAPVIISILLITFLVKRKK